MNPLEQLVQKLQNSYADRLVSVVLYGSAAAEGQADRFSDLNVLCVLKDITPRELADGEPIMKWWRAEGHPSPLLMGEEEVYRSADSFPIEFRDMQLRRKVLYGPDPIADITVHDTHYRAHVEHELRAALLRLRQQGAAELSSPDNLLRMCADSVSTFCVLGRHALTLAGVDAKLERHALAGQIAEVIGADMTRFGELLDIREGKPVPESTDPVKFFAEYLVSITRLIQFVDTLHDDKGQSQDA